LAQSAPPRDPSGSVILLELNEINFEYIKRYIELGYLPTFQRLIAQHGYSETTSEDRYEDIEPWIQWVTAHTGLTLAEHGVFRLGDITGTNIPQIWEQLESEAGVSVGAVCPMNAVNRLKNPAFFVPDPWTDTPASGPWLLRHMSDAISQAVNDNAQARLQPRSALALLAGWAVYSAPGNWHRYLRMAITAKSAPWRRAIFLDTLVGDVFLHLWRKHLPGFSSLFLNAGAHIQHHYMFSSRCYDGKFRNPDWYIRPGEDPLLEIYQAYDRTLAQVMTLPGSPRLFIATGLHQDPHDELTFYWRLRNHAGFLRRARLAFEDVQPRMSRDFLVICHDAARAADGERLFFVDNRGRDLFVMLEYPRDIGTGFRITINGQTMDDFRDEVVFVAIKNGKHNGIGYVIDSANASPVQNERFPLSTLMSRIKGAVSRHPTTHTTAAGKLSAEVAAG
jgi:hypothetical protein